MNRETKVKVFAASAKRQSTSAVLRDILCGAVFAIGNVTAATMEIVELPATGTDEAIDISATKEYTHTFDFGSNPPVTLNGVAFEQVVEGVEIKDIEIFEDTSSQGYGYSLQDSRWFLPNPNFKFWLKNHEGGKEIDAYCDGVSHDLFDDFLYFDRAAENLGEGIILTLKDLEPGAGYSVRYYYRPWDPPLPRPLTVYGDAESDSVFKDSIWVDIDTSRLGAQYVDYSFVTDDNDVTIKFLFHDEGQGPHLYGLTCEKLPAVGVDGRRQSLLPSNELWHVYSDPFDPNASIRFRIPVSGHVTISAFNADGRQVARVVDGFKQAGNYSQGLDGSLRSGVYIFKMSVAGESLTRKVFLPK